MIETISQIDFLSQFNNDEFCRKYLECVRWDGFVICPICGSEKVYITNRGFRCADKLCTKKFTQFSKTVFEHTKESIQSWLFLIYSWCINKKNVSSVQMAKNIGVTQKTMWGMQHKLRRLLKQDDNLKISGIVEVDEAFISKGNRWTRWGGISTRKAPILGMVERGGKVIIKCIHDRQRETILQEIRKHILCGSTIYTDSHPSYKTLPTEGYFHDFVEHSTREYVRGDIHSNTIENIWRFFKTNIRGAHHSISEKHCQLYCDEVAWRYNNRELTGSEKFNSILKLCLNIDK